jgi:hypothetical protein
MERWKTNIGEVTGLNPDRYLARFVEETAYLPAIERWTPALMAEVRGVGEAADVNFEDVYAYQLGDEEWLFRRDVLREKRGGLDHCTAMGVFDEGAGPPLLAQNMDIPNYYDGTQVLLHVKHHDSDLESFVFTPAGFIATTGLNNQGIGICCNTLGQLSSSREGLPVAFIVRNVLEQRSRQDATDFVRGINHAAGQNYAIGGPDGIVDLECSAGQVVQFTPQRTRVYHTNHPLVNDDYAPRGDAPASLFTPASAAESTVATKVKSNTEIRFDCVADRLRDPDEPITVEVIQSILSTRDTPICVSRGSPHGSLSLGSLVMELSVPPILHLAPGPPAETDYKTWTFS